MSAVTALRCLVGGFLLALLAWSAQVNNQTLSPSEKVETKLRLRRPVTVVPADDGQWLFVANRRSRSISVLDAEHRRLAAETDVGRRLADLAAAPDARQLFAVDEAANELILLSRRGPSLEVSHRLSVSPAPVSVRVAADGTRCFVASLWSRRLAFIDLKDKPRVVKTVALTFAPRRLLPVHDDAKLIVADAFGGRLAVVDLRRGEVESVRELPAHNIGGLALSADDQNLLVTHQTLAAHAQTTRDDIHWGNLLTNNIRVLPLANVLTPNADLLGGSRLVPL